MTTEKSPLDELDEAKRKILEDSGAFLEGHFLLTSGLHSPYYFQCAKLLEDPVRAEKLARKISEGCTSKGRATVVVTPAIGGIVFGHELARALGCRAIFAERSDGKMKLRRGFAISAEDRIMLAEDVITTGGSVLELRELCRAAGAQVLGYATLVDRTAGRFRPPEGLIRWIELSVPTYAADKCPLCAEGSVAVKPGSRGMK
ncbi:MAG: orotate phosphoribosyltransferase [bacterium]